jgi:DNA-binding MarR family transcriptional regulator
MSSYKINKINKNLSKNEITLRLLDSIAKKKSITQKNVAQDLGIAVGLVNAYIKRALNKGWLKVKNIPAHRYAYYLTPSGFSKKTQLVSQYLFSSFRLFRDSKSEYQRIFSICKKKKYDKIILVGNSDLTEIANLVNMSFKLSICGILDNEKKKSDLSYKSYNLNNYPKDVDAFIITEIINPTFYYSALKKKISINKILFPNFLQISKKKV